MKNFYPVLAGLFSALVRGIRRSRQGKPKIEEKGDVGLQIFANATMVQIFMGFWLLVALPEGVMKDFMGGKPPVYRNASPGHRPGPWGGHERL